MSIESRVVFSALVRRHLVYLIVECLTHHHTWFQRQQQQRRRWSSDTKEPTTTMPSRKKKHSFDYLPCNLMEIFAIYFPFCQDFFFSLRRQSMYGCVLCWTILFVSLSFLLPCFCSTHCSIMGFLDWHLKAIFIAKKTVEKCEITEFFRAIGSVLCVHAARMATKRHKTIYYFLSRQNVW